MAQLHFDFNKESNSKAHVCTWNFEGPSSFVSLIPNGDERYERTGSRTTCVWDGIIAVVFSKHSGADVELFDFGSGAAKIASLLENATPSGVEYDPDECDAAFPRNARNVSLKLSVGDEVLYERTFDYVPDEFFKENEDAEEERS